MLDLKNAQRLLKLIDPDTKLVVTEPKERFYVNCDREPQVGDIVSIPSIIAGNGPHLYLYTSVTRRIGHQNRYPTNWVSVRHGSPDTGPTWNDRPRTLVYSVPMGD